METFYSLQSIVRLRFGFWPLLIVIIPFSSSFWFHHLLLPLRLVELGHGELDGVGGGLSPNVCLRETQIGQSATVQPSAPHCALHCCVPRKGSELEYVELSLQMRAQLMAHLVIESHVKKEYCEALQGVENCEDNPG